MSDPFYSSVYDAVNDILSSMVMLEVKAEELSNPEQVAQQADLAVSIGIDSEVHKGMVTVYFDKSMALKCTESMFGMAMDDITDEVKDVCGEISNMICGSIKRYAVEKGVPDYNITVPQVKLGSELTTVADLGPDVKIYSFRNEEKGLYVELKVAEI